MRTSFTHPLQIAEVTAPGGGLIGITFCPGKHQPSAATGSWARDLGLDLQAIKDWGAAVLITLVTQAELVELQVEGLGVEARRLGMQWLHLPLQDASVPTAAWERAWDAEKAVVHGELNRDGRVLVHCKGGLGRAGTVAARILIERGVPPRQAIEEVRRARADAVETAGQERYLERLPVGAGR